jgi:ketosteroid isomerase-like protein
VSSKPIELARRWIDLYNARDLEGQVAIVHPEVEVVSTIAGLEAGGVFRGHAGYPYAYFKAMDEIFSDLGLEAREYIDLGESVCVSVILHGVARDSGAAVSQPLYAVWKLREGMLWREETTRSKRDGLAKLIEFEDG